MTTNTPTALSDIRDIKPPQQISSGWEWFGWVVAALIVVVAAYICWRIWRKQTNKLPTVPLVPPHARARQKLEEALALIAQPKPFCILVSDTIRMYLEERFDFHAPERTTEEFLRELRDTKRLMPDQKQTLGEFLESCDLVKFAKYEPRESELRGLHASALRLIEETEPRLSPAAADADEIGNPPLKIGAPE